MKKEKIWRRFMERFKGKIEGELELGTVRGWNGHENEGNIQE